MIIKNSSVKTIIAMVFLMSFGCAWSMEDSKLEVTYVTEFPLELLEKIFSKMPLNTGIESALALSSTCHILNEIPLDFFGKAFQHHDEREKNEILKAINFDNYWLKRNRALIVILSGALDTDRHPFMCKAVQHSDKEALEILFKKGANPNKKRDRDPIFFDAITKDVADLFKLQRADLNQGGWSGINVLWYNIRDNPSLELIEFYIKSKVSVKEIDSRTGDCLLHYFVKRSAYACACAIQDDYVRIGELLIKEILEMVNKLNNAGNTPMDESINLINNKYCFAEAKEINKQLIELFKKHGGKTARELK